MSSTNNMFFNIKPIKETDNGKKYKISIELPMSIGWIEDVNFVIEKGNETIYYKLNHKENIDNKAFFENEIDLDTRAIYRYYFSYYANGERQFHSRYDLGTTLLPGMSRIIVDEQEQAIASLRWKGDSRYDLMYRTEVIAIEMQEDGFAAYKDRNLLLEAKKVSSKKQLQAYRKEEYDMEWAYRIRVFGEIEDDLQMLILAFPMLRFAY